jgi:hypothetical protein
MSKHKYTTRSVAKNNNNDDVDDGNDRVLERSNKNVKTGTNTRTKRKYSKVSDIQELIVENDDDPTISEESSTITVLEGSLVLDGK